MIMQGRIVYKSEDTWKTPELQKVQNSTLWCISF